MSKSGSRDGSYSRRRSLFALSSLTQIHPAPRNEAATDKDKEGSRTLRKRKQPALITNIDPPELVRDEDPTSAHSQPSPSPRPGRPALSVRAIAQRPASSVFGSLRSMRSVGEDDTPLTTTSSKAPSVNWGDMDGPAGRTKAVLHHGEVQTSSGMFRKKKEYLVLTDTHILRCKSQGKASESFSAVPPPFGRSPTIRHTSSTSVGSSADLQSLHSDSSGDKEGRVPLRQVVAVHKLDDGRPHFAIEVCYLDEESTQASAMMLQFGEPEDRDVWLKAIRSAANQVRLQDTNPISVFNSKNAARSVERENDYDPANYAVYKIVQRQSIKSGRSSTDDLSKIASTVCFLAIGIHKVHIIPVVKATARASSPSLLPNSSQGSYGVLTLTSIRVHISDDKFELTFRQPLGRPKTLYLAALASHDIAIRLHHVENILRPEVGQRLYNFHVPSEVEDQLAPPVDSEAEEHCCFERTLTAYCIAYDVIPSKICYTIDYSCEDAPRFQLLPLANSRRKEYSAAELLSVMRALRYNETFGSISFSGVHLDVLNGLNDPYGSELVCSRTKKGTPIRLTEEELSRSCLLVQEIRALAATSKKLRRMDFSACITTKPPKHTDDVDFRPVDIGLVLDAFRAQENTMEALDISGNLARLSPSIFDSQISVFGFIRKLNLSYTSRTSGPEPLLSAETLLSWRLDELKLTGTTLNANSVQALAEYLRHPQSDTLHELYLDHAYLSGADISVLLQAMKYGSHQSRSLHLDISHNNVTKDYDQLSNAISAGHCPTHLTMRAIEYRDEAIFRHLINALRKNKTIRYLDMSRASLPSDASDDTSHALEQLFAENDTLEELDISGEDSRLETSRFGVGLNRALTGLRHNRSLHTLRVQFQRLGIPGASVLAEVLKENRTLREIHCEHNEIPLSALTDMINALGKNTTLIYLPSMDEGRAAALKHTEAEVKHIRDEPPMSPSKSPSSPAGKTTHFGVRKGFANVKKNVNRTASAYTPSFPSFPSSNRSTSTPTPTASHSFQSSAKTKLHTSSPISAPLTQLSDQDIQAALRLVAESWDRQQYRLQQYLHRNWCILQGIPTAMEIEEEEFERPSSIGSLSKLIEKVKLESTPTVERDLDFGAGAGAGAPIIRYPEPPRSRSSTANSSSSRVSPIPPQIDMPRFDENETSTGSFKHFLLGSENNSPEETRSRSSGEEDMSSPVLEMHPVGLGLGISGDSPARTPTQRTFFD
ncbi:hypothetical protein MBLNU459_g5375t1 [Dothideomycetes sp. NU459]